MKQPRPRLRLGARPGLVPLVVDGAQRCPLCHDGLRAHEALVACADCRAVFHSECLEDKPCVTLGCGVASAERLRSARPRSGRQWVAYLVGAVLLGGLTLGHVWGHTTSRPFVAPRTPRVRMPLAPTPQTKLSLTRLASGAYRLRGALVGRGPVQLVLSVGGREHVRFDTHAPGPLDLLVPFEGGPATLEVALTDSSGATTRERHRLLPPPG